MGVDDSADGQRPHFSAFKIERIESVPILDSAIPQHVTDSIINSEGLPSPLPKLGSSIIEDFIVDKIQQGMIESEAVADAFVQEGYPERIEQYLQELREQSDALDWDQIFSKDDFLDVKSKISTEMRAMDMTEAQVVAINGMGIQVTDSAGVSSLSDTEIYISKLQALRKALDYQKVFGTDISLEEILKTMMTVTAGHELGHQIDHITPGFAVNHISSDSAWFKDGKTSERKDERFAEYWGRAVLAGDEQRNHLRQREWALHVAKTNQVWDTVRNHNYEKEPKVELFKIFSALNRKLISGHGQASSFLESRMGNYGNTAAENYASPYPREVVSSAVQQHS